MDYLLDNPQSERIFQEILSMIKPLQNGVVVNSMKKRGVEYKVNFGVSIPLLRQMASDYEKKSSSCNQIMEQAMARDHDSGHAS